MVVLGLGFNGILLVKILLNVEIVYKSHMNSENDKYKFVSYNESLYTFTFSNAMFSMASIFSFPFPGFISTNCCNAAFPEIVKHKIKENNIYITA